MELEKEQSSETSFFDLFYVETFDSVGNDNESTENIVSNTVDKTIDDVARGEGHNDAIKPWTVVEREKLLTGLKEYGPLDIAKLQKMVGTRSVGEVLLFLTEMKNRSEREIESVHDVNAKAPIEDWLAIVGHLLDDHPDYTSEIERVLIRFASSLRDDPSKNRYGCTTASGAREEIEYSRILTHLSCLIKGCAVNQLSPMESFVVVQFLQRMADYLKTLDLSKVNEFLNSIQQAYNTGNLAVPYHLSFTVNPDDDDESIFDRSFNPFSIPPDTIEPSPKLIQNCPDEIPSCSSTSNS